MGTSVFGTVRDTSIQGSFDRLTRPQYGGILTEVCVAKTGEIFRSSQGWAVEVVADDRLVHITSLRFPTVRDVLSFDALEYVGEESTLPELGELQAAHHAERAKEIEHELRNFEQEFESAFLLPEPEIEYTPAPVDCCAVCDRAVTTRDRIYAHFISATSRPKLVCEHCHLTTGLEVSNVA